MRRDELIALIGELIGAGQLTLDEGRRALRAFDAGTLTLPDDPGVIDPAAGIAWIGAHTTTPYNQLSEAQRDNLREQLQDAYEERVTVFAERAGEAAWFGILATALAGYLTAQWLAAGGRDQQLLAATWAEQVPYLVRFGATVAIRNGVGRPLSPASVASRSVLYSGAGRGLWYAESENGLDIFGWVVDYVSVDDNGTCAECWNADRNSPYLPGVGPRPGQICLGRGRCRCKRIARYDPAEASRLRGRVTPSAATRPRS